MSRGTFAMPLHIHVTFLLLKNAKYNVNGMVPYNINTVDIKKQ
jgi:hypothetical protein